MKSVNYLVEYAKAQVGRPYWCGTYGQIADAALLAYKRTQYPSMYPTPGSPAFVDQIGQKVHDCNGLVYAASVCDTPDSKPNGYPSPYYGVPKLYEHCIGKGQVDIFYSPETGSLLFRNNLGHVGIYGGDGYVYHAKGHKWGVVKEKYNYKEWTDYGKFTEMYDYPIQSQMIIDTPEFLKTGSKGRNVIIWQQILLIAGEKLDKYGADGDFGSETKAATISFQKKCNIFADGVVRVESWQKGLNLL